MARRRLWLGVRIGPFIIGGSVGGRRRAVRRVRQYRPGVHPMMQDSLQHSIREVARRRAERRGSSEG